MKAVFLTRYGSPEKAFEIRETPVPALKPGQALIRTEGFGLNFADVMARNGMYREAPPLPCILGYECVGRVETVYEKENEPLIGKRVVAFARFGAYAEYVSTDVKGIQTIDDSVNIAEAAALATQYVTAWFAAIESANIREGNKILVHAGAGGVGTAIIQLAKLKNCTIFATTSDEKKYNYLRNLGVHHIINYATGNYKTETEKILKNEKLDVCFNPVAGSTVKKDLDLLGAGGKLILYGAAERSGKKFGIFSTLSFVWKTGIFLPVVLMMKSKSITGINMLRVADYRPDILERCLSGVMQLYKEGKIKPVSGGIFPAEKIAEAHRLFESRASTGKIAVTW